MRKIMVAAIACVCPAAFALVGPANQSADLETGNAAKTQPIGKPGQSARYRVKGEEELPGSSIKSFVISLGPIEERGSQSFQWIALEATKVRNGQLRVWALAREYPPESIEVARAVISRYILQEGDAEPREFQNRGSRRAVLPAMGGWQYLWPRGHESGGIRELFPEETRYLGQNYQREAIEEGASFAPPKNVRVIELLPEVLVGLASNTRQKDETRRYDGSDYELIPLTGDDYREIVEAGINCLHVDARQLPQVTELNAFYWGVGGTDIPFPECLYRSCYLGPALFLDEPAVGTRDYVIRPKLMKDDAFRKSLTPRIVFEAFEEHFRQAWKEGAPTALLKGLAARPDVALGDMNFLQENLFTWETVESSAAYQLSRNPRVPAAIVWEPPGRVGTLRTLPELDMTYGCQLPVDDPKNFTDIIYGFLRGAARLTDKEWGISIYGAVDRADAFWYLTHAYDLGATRFFFWDNGKQACVPYHECLALARNLSAHAASFPVRELSRLKQAADAAITLPPGYNLGHVALGKGSLWGLGELNLERVNEKGVTYRTVMSNFFAEVERCLQLGEAFDLLWDLPDVLPTGYREVIHVRDDGKIEVVEDKKRQLFERPRTPERSPEAPQLEVELSSQEGPAPLQISARAIVHEGSARVFYTYGTDNKGVYQNAAVAWEIYGPNETDYRFLQPAGLKPSVTTNGSAIESVIRFTLERPGSYRLRAATVDLAGRTTTVWKTIAVKQ